MRAHYYTLWGEKVNIYNNLPKITIEHPKDEPPLEVAIGIDPSSSTTGFTVGRTDMDYPFLGMEFIRDKDEAHFQFLSKMLDYIIYDVISCNNIKVTHIFTEDKFSKPGEKRYGGYSYNRHTDEVLSMVKVGIKSLPNRIRSECYGYEFTPQITFMPPSVWRKTYLGDLNTSAKRAVMKDIVSSFTVSKYGFNYNCIHLEDLMEAIGIYSAGFQKFIEPNLDNGTVGKVDFNGMDWIHHVEIHKYIRYLNEDTIKELVESNSELNSRKKEFGIKVFEYERGNSLEKNIRGLTTRSNSVFMTILDTWDLESIPIYYELGEIPKGNQKLIIFGYRKNIKKF